MTERKLASIQRVEALIPIDGADKIELAQIGGWNVVVKKGEFRAGDAAIFFEIDSVPPDIDAYRFLWQKAKDTEPTPRPANFRLKTKKMRGALSQGLLMPLYDRAAMTDEHFDVPSEFSKAVGFKMGCALGEGQDVTELLGVTKYEPPPPKVPGSRNHARRISDFPTHLVPKTDEERVQSAKKVLVELAGKPWIATLKCDGMSATYLVDPNSGYFVACSRNFQVAVEEENVWGRLALKYDLPNQLQYEQFSDYALQAEVVGPSAQGNPLGLPEDDLRVFSIFNIKTRRFLTYKEMAKVCAQLKLPMVPVVYEGDSFFPELANLDFNDTEKREETGRAVTQVLQKLLEMAEGKYEGTKNEREGLVIRPRDEEMFSQALRGRLSFKVISNRFLLAEKD